jgi:DNA-binding beta-propeller fold protein YncE
VDGAPGATGPPGPPGISGADAREAEFASIDGALVWRYVGEDGDSWRELAKLSTEPAVITDQASMIKSTHAAWEVVPLFTVGDRVGDYRPPGVLDGAGAFELDENTVRVLTNHELRPGQGYPYQLANGASLSGARISYFDIDRTSLRVKDSGLAYDSIVTRYGETLAQVDPDDGDLGDLRRFCSSVFVGAGKYGLVDDIYFTGEETSGGQLYALDVTNRVLYAVPQAGRAGYENVTLVPTGDPDTIGILIGDDRQGAPLLLYIGEKNAVGDGSFLDRNGLVQGRLYTWVSEVNRQAVPVGAVDTDPDDLGDWETSGVLDVTALFEADATTLLVNVQAHSMKGDLIGGENADTDLVQGAQMVMLRRTTPQVVSLRHLGAYDSGVIFESAAEIVAFDPTTDRAFVVNAMAAAVDVLDVSDPANPTKIDSLDASAYGTGINSVDVHGGTLAAAVEGTEVDSPGMAVFYDTDTLEELGSVQTGVLPDMIVFSPDGNYVLTADEGQPSDDYTIDPPGTITVIDVSGGFDNPTPATASFGGELDVEALSQRGLRVFGPGADLSADAEPEYITISPDSATAYVSLQENNAIAVVDIASASITNILPLGYKDHSRYGNELDASNEDGGINIVNWPVLGMYQPDAIASYVASDGRLYLVSANEGDARDYDGFSEEARVKDLTLDPARFPNAAQLQADENLGRLKTTTAFGDTDGDGDHDLIYSYGARSLTIWDTSGNVVFDSGSEIAGMLQDSAPEIFNSNGLASSFDSRSDDKGAEPEAIAIGELYGRTYAFLGLERAGGVVIYDITHPRKSRFVTYVNSANPEGDLEAGTAGDIGPEGIEFVPADSSPTGVPLLLVANEISGTTSIYQISVER